MAVYQPGRVIIDEITVAKQARALMANQWPNVQRRIFVYRIPRTLGGHCCGNKDDRDPPIEIAYEPAWADMSIEAVKEDLRRILHARLTGGL